MCYDCAAFLLNNSLCGSEIRTSDSLVCHFIRPYYSMYLIIFISGSHGHRTNHKAKLVEIEFYHSMVHTGVIFPQRDTARRIAGDSQISHLELFSYNSHSHDQVRT